MKTFAAFALMALASALKIELAAPVVDNELELAQADAQAEFWSPTRPESFIDKLCRIYRCKS